MDATTFLQIFVLVDVLLIGILAPFAYRHGRAHFKPQEHTQPEPEPAELPEKVKERLLKDSETKFEATIAHSINHLQHNLDGTTTDINNLIRRLAVDIVGKEIEQYREDLAKLHTQAEKELGGFKDSMEEHKAELNEKLAKELDVEKQRLMKQIDTRLGDAVSSFLLETLKHNVDLGSQTAYLMAMLEEHKAEFIKEVDDEKAAP